MRTFDGKYGFVNKEGILSL